MNWQIYSCSFIKGGKMGEFKPLQSFKFWCQKVIPLIYDDSISYYEVLCKLVNYINDMIANQEFFNEELEAYGTSLEQMQKDVDFIKNELDKIKNGEYSSLYIDALTQWLDNNMPEIIAGMVKYVFFGLTQDGYFCAYIPQSWDFIEFDTIVDPNKDVYKRQYG